MMLLKPINAEIVILNPKTRERVPMGGIVVNERDPFWRRRLAEQSMTAEVPPPPKVKADPAQAAAPEPAQPPPPPADLFTAATPPELPKPRTAPKER